MDIYSAYGMINKSLLDVVSSVNRLTPVSDPEVVESIRVEESDFVISEEIEARCQVVTAHNLYQYKNQFHSMHMQEDIYSLLEDLLDIDRGGLDD